MATSILEYIQTAADLSTLSSLVTLAGLEDALSDPDADLTLFAPVRQA